VQDILASEEVVRQRQEQQAQREAEQADQNKQIFAAQMGELATDAMKNAAQARKNLDSADNSAVKTMLAVSDSATKGVTGEQ
jgi:hypothetical protein